MLYAQSFREAFNGKVLWLFPFIEVFLEMGSENLRFGGSEPSERVPIRVGIAGAEDDFPHLPVKAVLGRGS